MTSLPFHTAAPQGDLFRLAVAAIDAGDLPDLRRLLEEHPALATRRLAAPGEWLRAQVGDALDAFFRDPWLLWFVAEDPIRNNRLPENILEVRELLIGAVRAHAPHTLQEQVDGALRLTSWSPVAARCGV